MKKKLLIGIAGITTIVLIGYGTMTLLGYQFVNPYKKLEPIKKVETTQVQTFNKEAYEYNKKVEASEKIYVSDTTYENNNLNTKITFTINNDSDLKASYMEFQIYVYDESGNMIHSDWTNESNISANSKRIKSTYVNMPEGSNRYEVVITDLRF